MEAKVGVHSGKMPTRKRPRLGEDGLEVTVVSEEDVRRAHHLALLAEKPASERGLEELVFGGVEEDEGLLLRRFQTSCAQVTGTGAWPFSHWEPSFLFLPSTPFSFPRPLYSSETVFFFKKKKTWQLGVEVLPHIVKIAKFEKHRTKHCVASRDSNGSLVL